jgi:type IX secretion system substrate protein
MKRFFFSGIAILYFLTISHLLSSQDTPYFSKLYDFDTTYDYLGNVQVYQDSLIFMFGSFNYNHPSVVNSIVFRLDKKGKIIWQNLLSDTSNQYDIYAGSDFDISGNQLVVPTYFNSISNKKSALTAFSLDGDSLWQEFYSGSRLRIEAIVRNKKGYVVTGYEYDTIYYKDIFIMQLDSFGKLLWKKRYNWKSSDVAKSIELADDNGFLIGGYSDTFVIDKMYRGNPLVIKTDSVGNILWMRNLGGPKSSVIERIANLRVTSDGYILVASGYSFFSEGAKFLNKGMIVKLNMQGDIIWRKFYGKLNKFTYLKDIIETKTGEYVAVGTAPNLWGSPLGWMIKTDTAGNILWERFHAKYKQNPLADFYFNKVGELSDGSLVTGDKADAGTIKSNRYDFWVTRTDSMGCWFAGCDTLCDTPVIKYKLERITSTLIRLTDLTKNVKMRLMVLEEVGVNNYHQTDNPAVHFYLMNQGSWVIIRIHVQNDCNIWSDIHDTIWFGPIGFDDLISERSFKIFPNPFKSQIQIQFDQPTSSDLIFQMLDISGRMIFQRQIEIGSQVLKLSTGSLPVGVYLYQVGSKRNGWETGKIVKIFSN